MYEHIERPAISRRGLLASAGAGVFLVALGQSRLVEAAAASAGGNVRHGFAVEVLGARGDVHFDFDGAGNAYELYLVEHRIVRRKHNGQVLWSRGELSDGIGGLNHPVDVAFDARGTLYVCDRGNHRIQVLDSNGRFLGSFGSQGDGPGQLAFPRGVTIARQELFVADRINHRVSVFNLRGGYLRSFGSYADEGTQGGLNGPRAVAVAKDGRAFVADAGHAEIEVFGANGAALGTIGASAGFLHPRALLIDAFERLWVIDSFANLVTALTLDGRVLAQFAPTDSTGNPITPVHLSERTPGRIVISAHPAAPAQNA